MQKVDSRNFRKNVSVKHPPIACFPKMDPITKSDFVLVYFLETKGGGKVSAQVSKRQNKLRLAKVSRSVSS